MVVTLFSIWQQQQQAGQRDYPAGLFSLIGKQAGRQAGRQQASRQAGRQARIAPLLILGQLILSLDRGFFDCPKPCQNGSPAAGGCKHNKPPPLQRDTFRDFVSYFNILSLQKLFRENPRKHKEYATGA